MPISPKSRIAYLVPVCMLSALLLLSSCATGKQKISGPVADVKQFLGVSQYYVKSNTLLRSQPEHTSKSAGRLSLNSKVTEVTRNKLGWSEVKSVEGKQQGWLPTSLLSKDPVAQAQKTKSVKNKSEKLPAAESKPATAEAVQKTEPAPEPDKVKTSASKESGGLLSPESAEAATIPEKSKPAPKTSEERKANPDMFDAF